MGAILQVLTHTRALRSAIDSSEHFCGQQFCPVDLLRNFMKEMQNGSLKPYNPSEFLNTLEDILKKTGANLKWDASTCFSGLLTGFEESGKPIAKIFLSEIIQEYYCHYCRVSVKRPIEYEAIDLHDIEGHTVTEAVRQFRVGKIIDRDCTFCNPGGEMEQIDYFSKLPQILVFKLKKSVANDAQLENEIILRDPDRTISWVDKFPHEDDPCMLFYEKGDPKSRCLKCSYGRPSMDDEKDPCFALKVDVNNMEKVVKDWIMHEVDAHCTYCKGTTGSRIFRQFRTLPEILTFEMKILENHHKKGPLLLCLRDSKQHHVYSLYGLIKKVRDVPIQQILSENVVLLFYEKQKITQSSIEEQLIELPNSHNLVQVGSQSSSKPISGAWTKKAKRTMGRKRPRQQINPTVQHQDLEENEEGDEAPDEENEERGEVPAALEQRRQLGENEEGGEVPAASEQRRQLGENEEVPAASGQRRRIRIRGKEVPAASGQRRQLGENDGGEVPAALEQRRQLGENEEGGEVPAALEQRRQLGENEEVPAALGQRRQIRIRGKEVPAASGQRRQLGENDEGGEVPAALEQRRQLGENEEVPAASGQRRRNRIRGKEVPAASGQRRRIRIRGKRERRYAGG
nr:hypothetical protein CFP56_72253 [Quercus suber]